MLQFYTYVNVFLFI